ncbi:MAG: UDP-N-acetylmuramoyl-L-alanine--D-glutamate ligase [Aminobacterium sp.]|jgi:UDP-N-acetylmuramoylalanine--D-glutamate ligase|uniref:UDP-N-acetylmuramoyl-L-alanine--D-glutamate ligase n=1 Tax=unclassified Aminobacterium TaxID=2685012 RepID=UPI001BCC0532|nr:MULTISPECIES: UDP-N-acetylmuramoyl-L-alanine--D-glutamate ligase [unclassified Aminobacterium]MDD2207422.1 UDP-N-acetylmuramoyl-L-alanine--D-glutamate ligase [Aminobacterium sp.]MDD3707674.1 UDP-N-acetylmuramoyl-L-alanine--D-glutamate ligase [Aminobacterium sp.]MDD4228904.1 UDP-N-acetylmuramoyl-L-alanine--D-glutamate ligase [Aminobacterium sp.]MDD4551846.1 UDP-N-acetylmuramoyl-L-alanine--D-glutamate ligase [Aminobacterium sp.]MEA4876340.1 UDP-N-acetylmuramoyl-L-alanine--D-glutamate ligase [
MTENIQPVEGKNITILGAGVSGKGLAQLAKTLGANVFVTEKKDSLPFGSEEEFKRQGIQWEVGKNSPRALEADCIVVSSGVSPEVPILKEARQRNIPIIGEIDFVAPHIRGKIIGVTGSNGKSTVTMLSGHLLNKYGYKTAVAGNIGNPLSLYTNQDWDFVVVELSSFQLYWAHLLKSHVAIVTNLAPDHIDWHGSYEKYIEAKSNLLHLQNAGCWAVVQNRDIKALNVQNRLSVASLYWYKETPVFETNAFIRMEEKGAWLSYEKEQLLFEYKDVPLIGRHNLENVAMTVSALSLGGVVCEKIPDQLVDFVPLPHRCTFVAEINSVRYIDDSKGTNVAASSTALASIHGSKVVILGGQGKGEDYAPLAEVVKKEARVAIVLGAEKRAIVSALENIGFTQCVEVESMEDAVKRAMELARPGETVLLSPACTSWDMYPSYKKRGEHFQHLVKAYGGLL